MALPKVPFTRLESYLDYIAKHGGGGGGGGDLSTLETLVTQCKAELQGINTKLTTANTSLASIDTKLTDGENEEY